MNSNITRQISANSVRSFILMLALSLIIISAGFVISRAMGWGNVGVSGFILASLVMNFISYFFSDKIVLATTGAKLVQADQLPDLKQDVELLSKQANIPTPRLYIIEQQALNAFATGRNHNNAAVAVTRGLVERLSREEVRGVIAHELAHVRNYDIRYMAIVSVMVGGISLIADLYWRSQLLGRDSENKSSVFLILAIVFALAAPFVAILIQLAISRKREYLADAVGAKIDGGPQGLASALSKIGADEIPMHASPATAHLFISEPNKKKTSLMHLFSTHPPVQERIRLLNSYKQ